MKIYKLFCIAACIVGLASCGGGGSSEKTPPASSNQTATTPPVTSSGSNVPATIDACDITVPEQQLTPVLLTSANSNPAVLPNVSAIAAAGANLLAINSKFLAVYDEMSDDRAVILFDPANGSELDHIRRSEKCLTSVDTDTCLPNPDYNPNNDVPDPDFHGFRFDDTGSLVFDTSTDIKRFDITSNGHPQGKVENRIVTYYLGDDAIIKGNIIYRASTSYGLTSSDLGIAYHYFDGNNFSKVTVDKLELCKHNAREMAISNNTLLVVAREGGLYIVDISDPKGSLKLLSHYQPKNKDFKHVATDGKMAYLADYHSVDVVDISNPANPIPKAVINIDESVGDIESVSVNNGVAVIATQDYKFSPEDNRSFRNGGFVILHKTSDPVTANSLNLVPVKNVLPETSLDHIFVHNAVYANDSVFVVAEAEIIKLSK